ncbi:SagB family peptide dehydrogenase [Nonomuraea sp. NPDC048881]|uniref:SagB family peptide dehydrogenase n=1 Tax=Nonomuraea sp. NPDC048881 TaxID=3155030 RepID=UPI0033F0B30D
MSVAREYVESVMRRAREPMEPVGFAPDWSDRPARHKHYPGTWRIPLPDQGDPLSELLQHSYGLLSRRMRLTGNQDSFLIPWHEHATWARGTASGGGLYPVEIYLVAGPSGTVPAGIYHYAQQHHALDRLLSGDLTAAVRAALPHHPEVAETDCFALLSVKFWKNSFKYNSFSYHVVTMDVGTVLGTWSMWSRDNGLPPLKAAFWFDDLAMNDLLGLDTVDESVFAVVPLPWGDPPPVLDRSPVERGVTRTEVEHSRRVVRFPQLEKVHMATLATDDRVPDLSRLGQAAPPARPGAETITLPCSRPPAVPVKDALRARRSSFGGFVASPPLSLQSVGDVLSWAAAVPLPSEVPNRLTRLALLVNHVAGLRPGVYDYQRDEHRLSLVGADPVGGFLQRNYFLNNYNLEQAAAVIAVIADPVAVISAIGDRGYRVTNAEVGAVTQAVYVACAATGLSCGAVLGFDNVAVDEVLRTSPDEWPLILIMIGRDRGSPPDLDYRLTL